jgi:hypothetical protein
MIFNFWIESEIFKFKSAGNYRTRWVVRKILGALLTVFLIYASAHAADKVRIAYAPAPVLSFFSLRIRKGS